MWSVPLAFLALAWSLQARSLEDSGVGRLLWNLARALKPQDGPVE